jgi:ParB-like chromosome segregation protein Spo0J
METLKIERVALAALHTDPANARSHGDRNLDVIRGSLARFGQRKPSVVDRHGRILAGNGTYEAAKALGWTEIDIVRTDLEGLEATAFAIADNRSAELAEWDDQALSQLLGELRAEDALDGVGFDGSEIDAIIAELSPPAAEGDVDDPGPGEPPEEPVSRTYPSERSLAEPFGVAGPR